MWIAHEKSQTICNNFKKHEEVKEGKSDVCPLPLMHALALKHHKTAFFHIWPVSNLLQL